MGIWFLIMLVTTWEKTISLLQLIPSQHFLGHSHWSRFGVFIVNFEQISLIILVFPLLTLQKAV